MKSLGGIGAIILGVVAILVSVGLQTIWAPPSNFTATTAETPAAPLTVVTSEVDIDPDDAIEYTVTGDGDFTLMYGQLRDIEAWVGDAAHNRIDGVNTDVERGQDPTVNITHVEGAAEVPNPVTSDLWLATQEVTDEVTQRWARNDAGEWGILIAADGTQPAPTEFSVSWVNIAPDSPWIMPLMIAGIVVIVIGLALLIWRFVEFRRRAKRTAGRRAATRGEYTGLTAADVTAEPTSATQTMTMEHVEAGAPIHDHDDEQATEIVTGLDKDTTRATEDDTTAGDDDAQESEDPDDSDDPFDHDPGDADAADATDTETSPETGHDSPASEDPEDDSKGNNFLRRTITALSALGLAAGLGIGPAHASTQSPEAEDLPEQVEEEPLDEAVDPEEPDTFPVVVDAQFDEILSDVVSTIATGDEQFDAEVIEDRTAGHALRVRQDSYRNHELDDDYGERVEISDEEVLATWMDRDPEFPRTIYTVTSAADGSATQLLVLRQDDARSQYQLIHNAPFAPGAELPGGSLTDHEVTDLAVDDSTDLVMSPDQAMETAAAYFDDASADAAEDMAENQWIDDIHEHQEELEAAHEELDTEVSVTRTIFDDSVTAVQLPDGSALVFGTMNSMESFTPTEGATVTVPELTQRIGEFDSQERESQVRIRYREQLALLVPAEGDISLVGYETVQSTVE